MKMLKKTHQKSSTQSNQMFHSLLMSQLGWVKMSENDDEDEGHAVKFPTLISSTFHASLASKKAFDLNKIE